MVPILNPYDFITMMVIWIDQYLPMEIGYYVKIFLYHLTIIHIIYYGVVGICGLVVYLKFCFKQLIVVNNALRGSEQCLRKKMSSKLLDKYLYQTKSSTVVHHRFRIRYHKDPIKRKSIYECHSQSNTTKVGCLSNEKMTRTPVVNATQAP